MSLFLSPGDFFGDFNGDSRNDLPFSPLSLCPAVNNRFFAGFCPLRFFSGGCGSYPFSGFCQIPKPPWILQSINTFTIVFYSLPLLQISATMSDNIRRKMQDIALGMNDAPIALPQAVCAQAAQANRLAIVGVLLNPKKQNMRALINQMPRLWGFSSDVVGRIVSPTSFQIVFQSEEALNLVLRRGPWSFSEWMLVTQRWYPNISEDEVKTIPFWIQIRGIPSQFLNREMVDFIGGTLGPMIDSDFNEAANLVDCVRIKVKWNIDNPLRFKRNFQFSTNENTILSFRYERLRNFCVKCGLLSHESRDCPLRSDDTDDDQDSNGDDGNNGDSQQRNVGEFCPDDIANLEKNNTVAGPSSGQMVDAVTSPSLEIDVDMTVEKWRYVQSHLQQDISPGFGKRKRDEIEAMLHCYDKVHSEIHTSDLYGDLMPTKISGIHCSSVDGPTGLELSEMSPGMDSYRKQIEEEDYQRRRMAKGKFREDEFIDVFEAYVNQGTESVLRKKRKEAVEVMLETPIAIQDERMVLFPFKEELCESTGSCSEVRLIDRGAGGPVPPQST